MKEESTKYFNCKNCDNKGTIKVHYKHDEEGIHIRIYKCILCGYQYEFGEIHGLEENE